VKHAKTSEFIFSQIETKIPTKTTAVPAFTEKKPIAWRVSKQ
jgi:hypothetical protein